MHFFISFSVNRHNFIYFSLKNVNLKLPQKRATLSDQRSNKQVYATAHLLRSDTFWLRSSDVSDICIQFSLFDRLLALEQPVKLQ